MEKKKEHIATPKRSFGLKDAWGWLWIIAALATLGYFFVYNPIKWTIGKHYMKKEGIIMNAVVTKEYKSFGYHAGFRYKCYYYQFFIDGKMYTDCTADSSFHPGDSLLIRYWPSFPSINMPDKECLEMGWDSVKYK